MENRVLLLGDKGKRLESKLCKVSLCNNGGNPPLWINPDLRESDFPEEFLETKVQLNRKKLNEFLLDSESRQLTDSKGNIIAKIESRGQHLRIN